MHCVRAALLSALVCRPPQLALRTNQMAVSMRQASSSFRNPHNLPVKTCVVCNRPFTWRKKWESCWDEVTTCSKKCNSERKKANRIAKGASMSAVADVVDIVDAGALSDASSDSSDAAAAVDDAKAARKAARKAAKAARRAKREGGVEGVGQKACALCEKQVDLLIRCQMDSQKEWKMVCGRCWKTPAVAGGVVDGDGGNPHYRYGGLWKNLHRTVAA